MEIVRVSKDDYERVMGIKYPDVYDGTDYLPDYFNMLLDMENVEAYAMVIDGKFVSFVLCTVVDDGKTLVLRAGRTHKDFQGNKYHALLNEHIFKTSVFSRQLEYYSGTGGNHVKGIIQKTQDGSLNKVLQQEFRYYGCSRAETFMVKLQQKMPIEPVAKMLQESDLVALLSNSKLCTRLFPKGLFIVDWVPYHLLKSNIPLFMSKRTSAVASRLQDSELALLTFAHYFRAARGLVCNVDVYGHMSPKLIEHLHIHFKNIPVSMSEKIVIRCFGKEGSAWNYVTSLMTELSLHQQEIFGSGLICFQNKLGTEMSSKL